MEDSYFQASFCNFAKNNTPPWVFFSRFLNYTNNTKSCKASQKFLQHNRILISTSIFEECQVQLYIRRRKLERKGIMNRVCSLGMGLHFEERSAGGKNFYLRWTFGKVRAFAVFTKKNIYSGTAVMLTEAATGGVLQGLRPCNFIKKRLQHRCVKSEKFLRTPILKNICE